MVGLSVDVAGSRGRHTQGGHNQEGEDGRWETQAERTPETEVNHTEVDEHTQLKPNPACRLVKWRKPPPPPVKSLRGTGRVSTKASPYFTFISHSITLTMKQA